MEDTYGNPVSIEVGPNALPGESRVRRLRAAADGLFERPKEGINTTWDIIVHSAETYGDKPGMGWREVLDTIEEEKEVTKIVDGKEAKETKKWQFFQLSEFKFLSFKEMREAISEVGLGLIELGIEKEEVFNIFSRTRYTLFTLFCIILRS
jgi:long-chain acyl-CoA synthetase